MADSKISALPAVTSVDAADEFAVNDAGVSKKATSAQILTYVNANITLGASLDVNTQEIVSSSSTDIVLHSDNDVNVILGDASGVDDFNVKDSASATVFSVNSDGAISAVSYGGVLEANLLDKSADETISGTWTFSSPISVNGTSFEATAGGTISAGEVVYMASTGKVLSADASSAATAIPLVGIALDSGVLDDTITVLTTGISDAQAGLTTGTNYYLSTTAGALTSTAPSGSGEIIINMGVATSATSLYVNPQIIAVLN